MFRREFSPSRRISGVREYYFYRRLKEIKALLAEGREIINLSIGSPDLPPPPSVIEELCRCAQSPDAHGYMPYNGVGELREALSLFYKKRYRVALDPEGEILPLMGSKEGIMHIYLSFVNRGEGVLIPNPGYPSYSAAGEIVGARIIRYDLREDNGWQPDFQAIEREHKEGKIDLHNVKLMWCNYPNMPTGAPASKALFERVVEFGLKWGIIICHDNPYSFILNNNPLSVLEISGAKEVCIELNSTSKTFNMAGWRVGMLASNQKFVEWILREMSNMASGMFKGLQLAAAKAVDAPQSWYEGINAEYDSRRILARKILNLIGCTLSDGQQGLFLWGKIDDAEIAEAERRGEIASRIKCDDLLYRYGICLAPGFIFGSNGDNYVRISLCSDTQTLRRAVSVLMQRRGLVHVTREIL